MELPQSPVSLASRDRVWRTRDRPEVVNVIDWKKLSPLLPKTIEGYETGDLDGGTLSMADPMGGGQSKYSSVTRIFKNGNAHIKFNKDFLLKFNIEAARILGWLFNTDQAAEELQEDVVDVRHKWAESFRIKLDTTRLLKGGE